MTKTTFQKIKIGKRFLYNKQLYAKYRNGVSNAFNLTKNHVAYFRFSALVVPKD